MRTASDSTRSVQRRSVQTDSLSAKLAGSVTIVVCILLGLVGLLLPILPGLLFLAIAAVLVARRSPSLARRLRSHRTMGKHFDSADRFVDLSPAQKVLVGGLFCAKMVLEGLAFVCSVGGKLLSRAFGPSRRTRVS